MTNHVHLLIKPHNELNFPKMMQMLARYELQFFNYAYQRARTLLEGRYKAR